MQHLLLAWEHTIAWSEQVKESQRSQNDAFFAVMLDLILDMCIRQAS